MKTLHKRGLSPIIATILLIAFAVALGAVAMNWKPNLDCSSDVKLNIVELGGKQDICYKNNSISFTLENQAEKDISGLKVTVFGSNDAFNTNVTQNITHGEGKKLNIPYDMVIYGSIGKVKFTPIVDGHDGPVICTANAYEIENIRSC